MSNAVAAFLLALTIFVSITVAYLIMMQFFSTIVISNKELAQVAFQSHEKITANLTMTITKQGNQYTITISGIIYNTGSNDITITNLIITIIKTQKVMNYQQQQITQIPVAGYQFLRATITVEENPTSATILLIILTQKDTTFVYKLQ
ncbi:MAG: hypothetical protein ACP5IZ_01790 [Thermoprotei archaeon]